ncbi:helix-turn-helix domain-containing protein [Brevibacillus reuszeri]|uniref:helix-turn-helix domain-containing protein n=1 Tax=Brevibacillus reuszeri TaxID=54915 RepID=UPI000CCBE3FF|nr:helix-turn-helix domain-containing protein [Brevibacillus reuszeri]
MKLLPLVRRTQEDNDEQAMMEIFQMFEPKIKKSLRMIQREDIREDYRQEVYIRIMKAVRTYDLKSAPDLIQFINNVGKRRMEKE